MNNSRYYLLAYIVLVCVVTYFIGMRGQSIGSDTVAYLKYFDYVKYGEGFVGVERAGAERIEIGFYWLTKIITYFTDSKSKYLSIIFLIEFIGFTLVLRNKDNQFKQYLFFALVWLSYPFFYSITLNALRQGLAFVFVIYAIDAKQKNKIYTTYALLLLGMLFHYTTLIYIVCFIALEFKPKYITLFWLWCLSVILAFYGVAEAVSYFVLKHVFKYSSHFVSYLNPSMNENYAVGFRWHFIAFSALPIAYYFLVRKHDEKNHTQKIIIQLYLLLNIFYLYALGFPYSDRIGLTSWLLIPLMIDMKVLFENRLQNYFFTAAAFLSLVVFSYYLF